MVTGQCLCGTVKWQVDGPLTDMTHCHCSMCRKAHAAPFATYTSAARDAFAWLSGADAVVRYESSAGVERAFCGECGSVVPSNWAEDMMSLAAGGFDGDPGVRPVAHIFVSSKAPWYTIADDLPQFEHYRQSGDGPVIERPPQTRRDGEPLRGSCLCGDVAYEVRAPFDRIYNCHCSRCRKARAAAHTTNGFTAIENVVFVRGEDRLKTYKLPSAKYFTQVFCVRCGSGMPRRDPERGLAVVPLGSLDDDPGRRAEMHIFVGSKASWYTISDDLPREQTSPQNHPGRR